jgi:hypothetical protein
MAAERKQVTWPVGQTIVKDNRLNEAEEIQAGPLYKTFAVTFHYLRRFHQLKVMKVSRSYDNPIYKVVLSSALKSNGRICWLKRQPKKWSLLLGNSLNRKLIATIGLAIECQE